MTEFQLAFSTVDEGDYFTGSFETFDQIDVPSSLSPGVYRLTADGTLELVKAVAPSVPKDSSQPTTPRGNRIDLGD